VDAIRGCSPEEIRLLAQTYLQKENMKEIIAGNKHSFT
jgi:predicted Zn-dependent peptidase